ncbi:MAG: polyprenyl synthetase family protein [Candidatus Cloacimonetes bacterium]|nr:polyprenyl synthetase family protein [Candidatus Cloacimonadota bacterium]MBS3767170.1 polyprenyl synthetase family protein [Candidatus Cloacimonadota bacterium]
MLLAKYFEKRRKAVNKALDKYLAPEDTKPTSLHKSMRHTIFAGGKRLRPLLFIATYEMLRGRKDLRAVRKILPVAAALEMVHSASLIHDDLPFIDNADQRRGEISNHKKFGNAIAILAGDALITKSFETILKISNKDKALKCLQLLIQACSTRGMLGGQVIEITAFQKKRVKLHMLRDIHLKKTGALLKASIQMASVLMESDKQIYNALGDFALNIGLAYQVIDDILDEVGADEILDKPSGEDLRNRKVTYPVLLGVEESKSQAIKLLKDAKNVIKYMPNNEVLIEFVDSIRDRIP